MRSGISLLKPNVPVRQLLSNCPVLMFFSEGAHDANVQSLRILTVWALVMPHRIQMMPAMTRRATYLFVWFALSLAVEFANVCMLDVRAQTNPCDARTGAHACTDRCGVCPRHNCCSQQCGCDVPCKKPCPPDTPRSGPPEEEDQPRSGPPGTFAAPPPTGVIESPSRGIELGGVSLTFPELTIGIPRLRFHGISHFHRDANMRLDSARAPYVAAPYGASMGFAGGQDRRADDAPRSQDQPRSDKVDTPRCQQPPPVPRSSDCNCSKDLAANPAQNRDDLEAQVRDLRKKLAEQTLEVQNSMTALENLTRRASALREPPVPVVTETDPAGPPQPQVDDGARAFQLRPLPATEQELAVPAISRTSFHRPVTPAPPQAVRLIRLPPVEHSYPRTPPRLFEP